MLQKQLIYNFMLIMFLSHFPTMLRQKLLQEYSDMYSKSLVIAPFLFRWWPAQICNPRDVPTNIQNMRHQPGEFPVQFLGSHDYYWIHRGRVFSYQEGDKGSSDSGNNKNLAKVFKKGKCCVLLCG